MLVLNRIREDERGVSLVEVLTSLAIGMVVLFAVLGLMTTMVRSSAESRGRTQAVREGRITIDRVGQELRLASCPDWGSAILSGTDDAVSYYVTRPQTNFRLDPVVERHTLTFDPAAGTLRLAVFLPTSAAIPIAWNATPVRRSVIGTGLSRVGATPFFQYLAYDSPEAPATSRLATPLAATALSQVGQVRVTFNARPDFGDATRAGSNFQSTVVLRTDDPTDEDNTPQC